MRAAPQRPPGYVEVVDLRDYKTYSALAPGQVISGFAADEGGKSISFRQQYAGAPFALDHRLQAAAEGIRWEVRARLLPGQKDNRSVQIAWMLPLPGGWRFWAPNDTVAKGTNGVMPLRAVYGHAYYQGYGILMPLVGVWERSGGAAVFSPPDIVKTQITFDVYTQPYGASARGQFDALEDLQWLRVSHHMIGLRPDKELKLAVCLAGVKPNWRAVLGHYVKSYPDLFEPAPDMRKCEGMYGITGAQRLTQERFDQIKEAGVTLLELHGSFPEYSVYVTPEQLRDPEKKYECKPHPGGEFSLASNRQWADKFAQAGVTTFMYFYNVHANRDTAAKIFPGEFVLNEAGRQIIQYQGEPALHGQPDSPFGKHMLEQMDAMLKAYPDVKGFFADNFSIQMVDFAHDDGVTMIHNRPAYNLSRNHQVLGPLCFDKARKAGRLILVNKLTTIESARGADAILAEGMDSSYMKQLALACVYRPFYPLGWHWPEKPPNPVERSMQTLLVLGGGPDEGLYREDKAAVQAYRPLTDCLIGKRWVFENDPLTLPAGYDGQVFQIDPAAPRAGDVVVTLAAAGKSYKDGTFTEGLALKVRLPGVDQFKTVTFLAVEKSGEKPVACSFETRGEEMEIKLPPIGAAGVVRLSR